MAATRAERFSLSEARDAASGEAPRWEAPDMVLAKPTCESAFEFDPSSLRQFKRSPRRSGAFGPHADDILRPTPEPAILGRILSELRVGSGLPIRAEWCMPNSLVSVIVPAYNAASTVQETLRSVLAQTVARIEVIVVDDGSTDDTAMAVADIAAQDARVRLERQPQCGVAAARNHAIRCASGEFIAPMDADDLWHPTKLERQLQRFDADTPDLGVVYSWFRYVDTNGFVLSDGPRPSLEGWVLHRHLQGNFIGNGSVPLVRSKALTGLGYEPSLQRQGAEGCEDFLLQVQLSRHWRFGCAPGFLIGYRRYPGAMSTDWPRMQRSFAAAYQILETELSGSTRTLCRRKHVEYLVRLSRNRVTAGRFGEAGGPLSKAFNTDKAHCLKRLAAEYGALPALALGTLRRAPAPSVPSAAFLDLDPMDVTRAAAAYPEWAA
jgi:hypothetical protein